MNEVRYSKQIKLKGFGLAAQQLLHKSKVLIIGAGGLGTPCAQYLNGAGVGTIGLVDEDIISISNLPRQTLFDEGEIGQLKVDVLSKKLSLQNPATRFICYKNFLTPANALAIIKDYDVVVDASDNFGTRYLVNDSCVILNKPLIYGAVEGFEGQVSVLNYKEGPTYRCIFPENKEEENTILNCDENGIIGVLPALIGTYQAMEVIKILTAIGTPLSGNLLIIDTLSQSHFKIAVKAIAANRNIKQLKEFYAVPVCSSDVKTIDSITLKDWIQSGKKITIIDVRKEEEFSKETLPGAINIPLTALDKRQLEIDFDLPVVIICQTGVRSAGAALLLLKENNLRQVFSLQGGLSSRQ
ncbi:HesA/MoeB/ThiF family protein [Ferruginibacter sp.]|uniref:HesA/MoeB/ThiF family protein n=1 Tax=Ferruginibacter sp. TaxID=1940288 RepID=UPI001988416F|nr:HesA/MoeB/ThiF family protein [Ferruginibacter sp.]MBC7626543.1 HesA/MoeB/ThiF family protein [Ferruginibacter sp.]